tara:strand:- start:126 stop:377 length:252 start_codon:yes stop_codon:yes gene_type:complete
MCACLKGQHPAYKHVVFTESAEGLHLPPCAVRVHAITSGQASLAESFFAFFSAMTNVEALCFGSKHKSPPHHCHAQKLRFKKK